MLVKLILTCNDNSNKLHALAKRVREKVQAVDPEEVEAAAIVGVVEVMYKEIRMYTSINKQIYDKMYTQACIPKPDHGPTLAKLQSSLTAMLRGCEASLNKRLDFESARSLKLLASLNSAADRLPKKKTWKDASQQTEDPSLQQVSIRITAHLDQAASSFTSKIDTLELRLAKVTAVLPRIPKSIDYRKHFDVVKENNQLKTLISKLESMVHPSSLDQLKMDNENLREQLREFVCNVVDSNSHINSLNEQIDKLVRDLQDARTASEKDRPALQHAQEEILRLRKENLELVSKLDDLATSSGTAGGTKELLSYRMEIQRLKSVIGVLEKDHLKHQSKMEEVMRVNKRSREERSTYQEANEKLIASNKDQEQEIRYLLQQLDAFSTQRLT